MASPPAARATLLDSVLPVHEAEVAQFHAVEVHATPEATMVAVKTVRPGEVPWLPLLYALRALPARLLTRPWHWSRTSARRHASFLQMSLESGFVELAESERELVIASIAQFWKLTGSHTVRVASADEFRRFAINGYARTAMSFRVEPLEAGRVRLTTETRVAFTDAVARHKFRPYWMVIGPWAGLIRWEMLRAIKRRAERQLTTDN